MKVRWTLRADVERDQQIDYVAARSPKAAAQLERRIQHSLDILEEHPFMGRPGRVRGTRELVIPRTSFLAYYRIDPDEIVVLRFFHTAQRRPGWRR